MARPGPLAGGCCQRGRWQWQTQAATGSGRLPAPAPQDSGSKPLARVKDPGSLARVTGPGVTGQRESGPRGRPRRRRRPGATAGPWRPSRCRPRGASPGGGSVTAEPRRGSEAPLTSTFIFEGPQRRTGQPDVPRRATGPGTGGACPISAAASRSRSYRYRSPADSLHVRLCEILLLSGLQSQWCIELALARLH